MVAILAICIVICNGNFCKKLNTKDEEKLSSQSLTDTDVFVKLVSSF